MMQMLVSVLLFIILLIPGSSLKVHVRNFKSTFNAINVQLTYSVPTWELKLPSKFVLPLRFQFHLKFERNSHSIDVKRDRLFQWTMQCRKWAAKGSRDDIASQIVYLACWSSQETFLKWYYLYNFKSLPTYILNTMTLQKHPWVKKSLYCQ